MTIIVDRHSDILLSLPIAQVFIKGGKNKQIIGLKADKGDTVLDHQIGKYNKINKKDKIDGSVETSCTKKIIYIYIEKREE